MGLRDRLPKTEEPPYPQPENQVYRSTEGRNAGDRNGVRASRRNHPLRRATDLTRPSARPILSIMSTDSGPAPEDEVSDDHLVASSLPVEQSVIDAEGKMDNHRRPIISVNGKDIDEHELGKNVA